MTASPAMTSAPDTRSHIGRPPTQSSLILLPAADRQGVLNLNVWMRRELLGSMYGFERVAWASPWSDEVWTTVVSGDSWRSVVAQLPDCGWTDPTEVFLWVKPQGHFPRVYRADGGHSDKWLTPDTWPTSPAEALA